jgi:DNA repair exonuclease SbcCD ATPase subunit
MLPGVLVLMLSTASASCSSERLQRALDGMQHNVTGRLGNLETRIERQQQLLSESERQRIELLKRGEQLGEQLQAKDATLEAQRGRLNKVAEQVMRLREQMATLTDEIATDKAELALISDDIRSLESQAPILPPLDPEAISKETDRLQRLATDRARATQLSISLTRQSVVVLSLISVIEQLELQVAAARKQIESSN